MIELSLVNDLRERAVAAERVDAFCAEHGLSPGIAFAVNVSVDELLTNTISYGFDDGGRHRIEMSVRMEGSVLVVELADDAKPYDPTAAPHPDIDAPIEERPIGGLGGSFRLRADGRVSLSPQRRAQYRDPDQTDARRGVDGVDAFALRHPCRCSATRGR